ncbi:hypothetical protein CLU79DRAFT_744185 [Phycomyces nitens]|nr:hypothetical protein CLU79DRAFT_744185 [Phycomyces nitens]
MTVFVLVLESDSVGPAGNLPMLGPGNRTFLVAADSSKRNVQLRRRTTTEYYHFTGPTLIRARSLENNSATGMAELERDIPTSKMADMGPAPAVS